MGEIRIGPRPSLTLTIFLFLSNLLDYYFRLISIRRYETPCVCSYGVDEPGKKVSQKSAEYIGVKKIVKIGKSKIFGRFSCFCPTCSNIISDWFKSVGMKLLVFVHMV